MVLHLIMYNLSISRQVLGTTAGLERCSLSPRARAGSGCASILSSIHVWTAMGSGEPIRLPILDCSFSVSLVLDQMFVCPSCEPGLAADCQVIIILITGLLG